MSADRIRPGSAKGKGARPGAETPGAAAAGSGSAWVPGGAAGGPTDEEGALVEVPGEAAASRAAAEGDAEIGARGAETDHGDAEPPHEDATDEGAAPDSDLSDVGDDTDPGGVRAAAAEVALPTWDEPAPPVEPRARRGRAARSAVPPARAAAGAPATRAVSGRFFARLFHGETSLEFVGRRRTWFTISAIVIVAGIISLGTRGLNLDIEFVGGTSWTVQWPAANITQARNAIAPFNLSGSTITILGQSGGKSRSLQVEAKIPKGQTVAQTQDQLVKVEGTLARLAHVRTSEVSITSVGPSWGGEVTKKALEALIVFFVLVALYISVFFEWRMALSAIIAVLHDILVVVGIYSLTGFDVTPDTVVAILTILGYSLYDTIVVFDRIRDNLKGVGAAGRLTISEVVNLSMNQTLARSINTSLVAILPIFAVLVLGAEILGATTLQYFGWALLIGLASGAYSSIFIASPIVAVLKEREPRWRRIRERIGVRGEDALVLSSAALAAGLVGGGEGAGGERRARAARAQRAEDRAAAGHGADETRPERPTAGSTARAAGGSGTSRSRGGRPGAGRAGGRPGGGQRHKGGRR